MVTRHLYFTDRAEYYRRKDSGRSFDIQTTEDGDFFDQFADAIEEKKTYFVNFEISEARGYVVGSLSSPKKIPMLEARKIIRVNCPAGYTPINFYDAETNTRQEKTIFVIMREDTTIIEVFLNV